MNSQDSRHCTLSSEVNQNLPWVSLYCLKTGHEKIID